MRVGHGGRDRRRYSAVVVAGLSVFFVYTGLEVGAGQWEASFCRGHLNLSTSATGRGTTAREIRTAVSAPQ